MDTVRNSQPPKDLGGDGERLVLVIAYVLHGLCFTFITAIIALIINFVKMRSSQSAMIRSHHRWLWRTFWWGLLWATISLALSFVVIGFGVFLVVCLWWLYRVIYGAINLIEGKPMPGSALQPHRT